MTTFLFEGFPSPILYDILKEWSIEDLLAAMTQFEDVSSWLDKHYMKPLTDKMVKDLVHPSIFPRKLVMCPLNDLWDDYENREIYIWATTLMLQKIGGILMKVKCSHYGLNPLIYNCVDEERRIESAVDRVLWEYFEQMEGPDWFHDGKLACMKLFYLYNLHNDLKGSESIDDLMSVVGSERHLRCIVDLY